MDPLDELMSPRDILRDDTTEAELGEHEAAGVFETGADIERFFKSTWRYFETADKQFEHPTPIQGSWKINGISLPKDVLKKVYAGNADRLLGISR